MSYHDLTPREKLMALAKGLGMEPQDLEEYCLVELNITVKEFRYWSERSISSICERKYVDVSITPKTIKLLDQHTVQIGTIRRQKTVLKEGFYLLSCRKPQDSGDVKKRDSNLPKSYVQKDAIRVPTLYFDTGSSLSALSYRLAEKCGLSLSKDDVRDWPVQVPITTTLASRPVPLAIARFVLDLDTLRSPVVFETEVTLFESDERKAILGLSDVCDLFQYEDLTTVDGYRVVRLRPRENSSKQLASIEKR